MTPRPHLALLILLCSSNLISSIRRTSDNDSPLAAYLVTVRRPDGLFGVDEQADTLELWHTYLLSQVCNTSDPATAERFPTAESRLIYSYSHVVSGFSAWLTPLEVADMARRAWFVEAIPDKSYRLMSVDEPAQLSWLDTVRDGVWSKGNMGEGVIIGVLDAGAAAAHLPPVSPDAQGTPSSSSPAKWNGGCDNGEACDSNNNDKLVAGLRTFMDTTRAQGAAMFIGEVGPMAPPTSEDEVSSFVRRASVLGAEYDKAFAAAPKAHLAVYRVVCNEDCRPAAVSAGMAAAVDDGADVVSISVGANGTAAFHDAAAAVTAPSYKAFDLGVLVCAPAGSSGADMLQVESDAPWLLTVAASDADRRVVTNAELGSGVLKPDVSAPGLEAPPHGGAEHTDAQIRAATSAAAAQVSGVAAMIKKARHEWSPAAIKSALVTTADPVGPGDSLVRDGASCFATGAGEVNPAKAMDPGLVYDLTAGDFIPYLCGLRLGEDRIRRIAEPAHASCAEAGEIEAKDLNYPSMMIAMADGVQQVEAKRTVTNVGEPAETYRAEVTAPGVDVAVSPSTLLFSGIGQNMDFVVTVKRQASTPAMAVIEGELKWVSEKHVVRSPMVVVVGETAASSAGHSYGDDVASIES